MKTNYWTGLSIVATTVTVSTMTTTPGDSRVNVTQATQPTGCILVRIVLIVQDAPDSIWFRLPRHRRVFWRRKTVRREHGLYQHRWKPSLCLSDWLRGESMWDSNKEKETFQSKYIFFLPRRRVYRHWRVSTFLWSPWECELHLYVPHVPQSSWRSVDLELLRTAALFFRRCLHQLVLQEWARIQVCSSRPDLCCCGDRGIELELRSWSS